MPRFVVERDFPTISDGEVQEVVDSLVASEWERFPAIEWEHTHVCHGPDGGIKSFCVYKAPSAQVLYDHAETIGAPSTHRVYELVGDVDPREVRTGGP